MKIIKLNYFVKLLKRYWDSIILVCTPLLWMWLLFVDESVAPRKAMKALYVLILMATYWITTVIPIPVTSLLPIALFPLLGIASTNHVASQYMNSSSILLLGGMIMALAVEGTKLHTRVALKSLLYIGTSPRRITFGLMFVSALLSMLMPNTATTAMMMPIVQEISYSMGKIQSELSKEDLAKKRNLMLLSIAYAANVGGTGLIIGSPPNLLVLKALPPEANVNFASWIAFAFPMMIINLVISWLWISFVGPKLISAGRVKDEATGVPLQTWRGPSETTAVKDVLMDHLKQLGPMKMNEYLIAISSSIAILLWVFRKPNIITGWAELLEELDNDGKAISIGPATTLMLVLIIVFALPATNPFKTNQRVQPLIKWDKVQSRLEWSILLLFGGGFALAEGIKVSGLSMWISSYMTKLADMNIILLASIVSLATSFITELVSNTATAVILLPILVQMSLEMCQNPITLVLSTILSTSLAFMLPVATPPNAIVYSASSLRPRDMMLLGFCLNVFCVLTTILTINTWASALFGLGQYPEWAEKMAEEAGIFSNCTSITNLVPHS